MAKAFSIRDFMQDARQQDSESDVYECVSVYDIGLNPRNEYAMSEIEKMKDSIYALGGVQQNVVLVRCPEGADHKYLALDGHRRLTASRELVTEGYEEFEFVPAVIKGQVDADTEDAMLIMMNSTQRNKTDWEKVMEHMRLKEIIPKLKKRQNLDGRTRDIEADMLGISQGQISIYNMIGTRLNEWLMNEFKKGHIGISLAYEAAKLEPILQQKLVNMAIIKEELCEADVKRLADNRPIEGQIGIETKNVTESVTSEKSAEAEPKDATSFVPLEKSQSKPIDIQPEAGNTVVGESVTESVTCEIDQVNTGKKQNVGRRGGYTFTVVDSLIKKYDDCLNMAGKDGGLSIHICEYNCLLDALDLLRETLVEREEMA